MEIVAKTGEATPNNRYLNNPANVEWHGHNVIVFSGKFDTRKGTNRDYKTRTLQDIIGDETPACVEKEQAPSFIPSSYCQSDARTYEVQRERGSFVCITGDIDKGNHDLTEVVELVQAFAGWGTAFRVYSSSRATEENKKWRVLIPMFEAVPFQRWNDLQCAFILWMRANGVELDAALTKAGQPVFLPNVPPDKRDESGQPLFYQTHSVDGYGFSVDRSEIAGQWLGAAVAEREEAEAKTAKAAVDAKAKAAKRTASDEDSPIDRFNDAHDVDDLLLEYGYTPGPGSHWRSPLQTSSSFGTLVKGQHWVSVSGSDRDAGLGAKTKNGNCHGDAFDLFVHFRHGGDRDAALSAWVACSPRPPVGGGATAAPTAPGSPDSVQVDAVAPHLSEIALAEEFACSASGSYRWTPGMDWLRNMGRHWGRDTSMQRYQVAKGICKGAAAGVGKAHLQAKIASSSTVNAVLSLARTDAGIVTEINEWDANPMILNTPAGPYNLETGKPESGDGLLFTQITGVAPAAMETPVWDKFLASVFRGDDDKWDSSVEPANTAAMVEFIQRMCGYFLTGSIREEKIFYCYGTGANGKSVLLKVLYGILGAYAHNLPSEVLMTSKHERHPTSLASLHGKRLAVSSEVEDGAHWAEARMKSLSGDETTTAHFMRGDDFTFRNSHKHLIAGNFKPRLKGDDPAMVRRIVLIPFKWSFKGKDRDDFLSEKLRAEYPGILQWFIEGARKWCESGLKIPEAVTSASSAYMAEMNDIALWIEECCERNIMASDSGKNLYASYSRWKLLRGEKPQGRVSWTERLVNAGFPQSRYTGKKNRDRGFDGIKTVQTVAIQSNGTVEIHD